MGDHGGFYKGEKKKQKKGKDNKNAMQIGTGKPTFTLPEIVTKKKDTY